MLKVNYGKIKIEDDVLVVDKQVGWTSHDVVAKIRGELSRKYGKKIKVGHGGTLDPFATGVLLILIGKACRRFEEYKGLDKEYVMEVKLGEATDTGDKTGKVIKSCKVLNPIRFEVEEVLKSFVGEYIQEVPIYSAVKVQGKKLYEVARKGQGGDMVLPKRKVKIMEMEFIRLQGLSLELRVKCGSGTYMRSLAQDIGKKLKLPAYAKELKRTKVGEFSLKI